jgi:hypothetical protein
MRSIIILNIDGKVGEALLQSLEHPFQQPRSMCLCVSACMCVWGWVGGGVRGRVCEKRGRKEKDRGERDREREIMNEYFGAYPHPGCRSVVDSQRNYFRT